MGLEVSEGEQGNGQLQNPEELQWPGLVLLHLLCPSPVLEQARLCPPFTLPV